jgi:hypothetical protein
MIRTQRCAHRTVFAGLAVAVPALLCAAWRARPTQPVQELARELLPVGPPTTEPEPERWVYWTAGTGASGEVRPADLPIDAQLVGTARGGALALEPPAGQRVVWLSWPRSSAEPR